MKDYIICPICKEKFKELGIGHIRSHGIENFKEFKKIYPDAEIKSELVLYSTVQKLNIYFLERKTKRIEEYNKNPKLCAGCKQPLPFSQKLRIYHSSKCSTGINSKGRIPSKETKDKIRIGIAKYREQNINFAKKKTKVIARKKLSDLLLDISYKTKKLNIRKIKIKPNFYQRTPNKNLSALISTVFKRIKFLESKLLNIEKLIAKPSKLNDSCCEVCGKTVGLFARFCDKKCSNKYLSYLRTKQIVKTGSSNLSKRLGDIEFGNNLIINCDSKLEIASIIYLFTNFKITKFERFKNILNFNDKEGIHRTVNPDFFAIIDEKPHLIEVKQNRKNMPKVDYTESYLKNIEEKKICFQDFCDKKKWTLLWLEPDDNSEFKRIYRKILGLNGEFNPKTFNSVFNLEEFLIHL